MTKQTNNNPNDPEELSAKIFAEMIKLLFMIIEKMLGETLSQQLKDNFEKQCQDDQDNKDLNPGAPGRQNSSASMKSIAIGLVNNLQPGSALGDYIASREAEQQMAKKQIAETINEIVSRVDAAKEKDPNLNVVDVLNKEMQQLHNSPNPIAPKLTASAKAALQVGGPDVVLASLRDTADDLLGKKPTSGVAAPATSIESPPPQATTAGAGERAKEALRAALKEECEALIKAKEASVASNTSSRPINAFGDLGDSIEAANAANAASKQNLAPVVTESNDAAPTMRPTPAFRR